MVSVTGDGLPIRFKMFQQEERIDPMYTPKPDGDWEVEVSPRDREQYLDGDRWKEGEREGVS